MSNTNGIGVSIPRKEAFDKVTGTAKYTDDFISPGMLYGKILTSPHAHAKINSIDVSSAKESPGVKAVITGDYFPTLCGTVIEDRPPIARDKVRYNGEPVAVVVANSEQEAMKALKLIKVEYEPLPVVNSISDALKENPVLVHENLEQYTHAMHDVYPEMGTNIADRIKIRKGDVAKGWGEIDITINGKFSLPQSDHIAMETRNVRAQILPGGRVIIYTSSQGPFSVKKLLSKYYGIPEGDIIVKVPFVGGGFGGKAPMQLEVLAYLASKAVNGKLVRIANSREDDMKTSPCRIGVEADIKIGATKDGIIKVLEAKYMVDSGAYTDIGPRMAKSIAVGCSGPYNIENVWCDAICVYTNHTYVTSYRGFGHAEYTFCMERMMDKLATQLAIDPIELRMKNAIKPGQYTPTQVKTTLSNIGNLSDCITKLKELAEWDEGQVIKTENGMIRAKGMGCFWKTSDSPVNAVSGVFLTFNTDGSINLNSGAVEIGPAMKTTLAQILAEKMKMDVGRIHVFMGVDTQVSPEHWKTVASMTTFMAGRAVLRAAEDLMKQLKSLAADIMKNPPEDLEIENEKVYLKQDPEIYVGFEDLVRGFKQANGLAIEGQILGRGSYIMSHITDLDKDTGKGKPGPAWTVGAQAVEIEYDPNMFTYRLLKAITVIDAGKVINPKTSRGLIMGGVNMGFGIATREAFEYNSEGELQTTTLRTYKPMRFGENPEYVVEFIETPQIDAPFGARGLAEHGIIAIPAAFANAMSSAADYEFDNLPIIPEMIWRAKTGGKE
ncbi:xanthine dehydrogenase family protein molybdopterin-binding subunit [Clostridium beijerinckii]|uniref:Aldehyde oxidase n=1 Tax=Clostridium beijerinckii TaxID=1520 RepID=A0A1S9N4T6_CLOBE|nr:xanthine dehydrogenase family protein molybdopterin-binding subunit [Clostridium beijerinckii]MZK51100.1 molybdopterin-dependent oxidoreductase [Clostridium beijerinckii]MZK59302.1 molybdopterin-dependent oxidoreductase [Clostridium beijerinckii]MZK69421.1 molybdopterin-dependent oxidoreductase [Clostridium beijerinckii]MZK74794.1 molybdopterin-dependent oxidoreductase [Clostridium beijerinckii]MZK84512.1 molybdopterin-dependent oxidoreductase [Clostridium beijerinckii]